MAQKLLLAAAAVAAIAGPIAVGIIEAAALRAQVASNLRFEVASIKPVKGDLGEGMMQPLPGARVRDLIVIVDEDDEMLGADVERRRSATLLLPRIRLALIQESILRRRHKLLRNPAIAAQIGFVATGDGDARRVMEIVVPETVERRAALIARAKQRGALGLVLADHDRRLPPPDAARPAAQRRPPAL